MAEKRNSFKEPFSKEFDREFYEKQINLIDEDIQHYKEQAQSEYETAEDDYMNNRDLTVEDSNGHTITLQMVNRERQFIKRTVGLIAGSKDSIKIDPVGVEDKQHSDLVQLFIESEITNLKASKLKQAIVKDGMKIGNSYIGTFFDARRLHKKYGNTGVITQERLRFDEVILDKNSRDNMDYDSSTFRDRETRVERMKLDELKRRAKLSPYINPDLADNIPAYILGGESEEEQTNSVDEDHGYLFTHEFRRMETIKEDGEEYDDWIYYTFTLINNSIDLIVDVITESPVSKFMIDVYQYEVLDHTPYSFGYMYDTKQERQLLAEAITAEMMAIKSSFKETIFIKGMTDLQAKHVSDNIHKSNGVFGVPKSSEIQVIGGKPVSPVYDSLIQRTIERFEEKGGEYPLQAGKQSYASETGKLANILNSRSDLSKHEDIMKIEALLSSAVETFLLLAQEFYNMEMIIPRLADDGSEEIYEYARLNINEETMLDKMVYDIRVKIDLNSDVKKQQNVQLAQANADKLHPEDSMEMQGIENPKVKHKNWLQFQGILEISELIKSDPEAKQMWDTFYQQQMMMKEALENAQAQTGNSTADRSLSVQG